MNFHTIKAMTEALRSKTISSVELTNEYLKRIQQHQQLNAYISVDEEGAQKDAQAADERIAHGQATPLTGIPLAHKDIFCTTRLPTTCGSKMLERFNSPYDATIVSRLMDQGTVMLGKTNMDEFAMGSSNQTSFFGSVQNPWDTTCVPGGSSGGSAAAVAAELCAFATGSDTGGSIRQPAAFCGISGLKPTYGLSSRFGMIAYASSLDQAGVMAQTAEDISLVLQAIAGFDAADSTSAHFTPPDYHAMLQKPIDTLRIGLPRCFFHSDVEVDIQKAIHNALKVFESLGARIVDIDLPLLPQWVPCYYVIACAEASSNLARFDGVRYGHRAQNTNTLRELITQTRVEGFGSEVKQRILTGTHVLSSGFYDAYYVQAQKVRRLIRDELKSVLSQVDVILGPTTPTCAFAIGEKSTNPTHTYLADIFTVGVNLAGMPAISIPAGFNKNGLPIGMQLIGTHFSEDRILQIAHQFQQHTDWHQQQPHLKGALL